ncbi:Cobalamin synthase [hydrothermal vent metagenome]|uniref:Adenosylcobinamide-GDP ribazoletransferase n=1 Tax=hydrothermal vent metagenome TaxID=652676 RepID=A0A3B0TPV0_9ZZZZ
MAVRFFSRLPSGTRPHQPPSLARIAPVLGFTGILIGVFPALVLVGSSYLGLPPLLAAVFAIGLQVIITGAMAEDALADSADGLWGGATIARRLEIMKDSRQGTYGVLAIVLLIAARLAILSFLVVHSPLGAGFLWLGAQIIARQGALWLPSALSPARPDGLAQKAGILPRRTFWLSSAISALVAMVLAVPFAGFAGTGLATGIAALIIWGWTGICRSRVGGFSGDLIGALQAMVEIGVLSTFILFI